MRARGSRISPCQPHDMPRPPPLFPVGVGELILRCERRLRRSRGRVHARFRARHDRHVGVRMLAGTRKPARPRTDGKALHPTLTSLWLGRPLAMKRCVIAALCMLGVAWFGASRAAWAAAFDVNDTSWEGCSELLDIARAELGSARVRAVGVLDWDEIMPE